MSRVVLVYMRGQIAFKQGDYRVDNLIGTEELCLGPTGNVAAVHVIDEALNRSNEFCSRLLPELEVLLLLGERGSSLAADGL